MNYRPSSVLVGLHYRKAMYQRTMLAAWLIVLACVVAPTVWFLHPGRLPAVPNASGGTAGRSAAKATEGTAGGAVKYGQGNGFARLKNVPYRIIREGLPDRPTVAAPPESSLFQNIGVDTRIAVGMPDVSTPEGVGIGTGGGAGVGNSNFGLPEEPLYAHTIGNAGWPGWGRDSLPAGRKSGSPAVIEWVAPKFPRLDASADVACLITLDRDGHKTIQVLLTETWVEFNHKRSSLRVISGPDRWGYAKAVVSALERSIFRPATDGSGHNLPGRFIFMWRFCPECPPEIEPVRVLSGNVILRAGRS